MWGAFEHVRAAINVSTWSICVVTKSLYRCVTMTTRKKKSLNFSNECFTVYTNRIHLWRLSVICSCRWNGAITLTRARTRRHVHVAHFERKSEIDWRTLWIPAEDVRHNSNSKRQCRMNSSFFAMRFCGKRSIWYSVLWPHTRSFAHGNCNQCNRWIRWRGKWKPGKNDCTILCPHIACLAILCVGVCWNNFSNKIDWEHDTFTSIDCFISNNCNNASHKPPVFVVVHDQL